NRQISEKTLKFINKKFKDILTSGEIKVSPPTSKEIQEKEFLNLPRLVMNFNLRDFGRLCEMIQVINKD
ncbi:MAG: cytochrome D ubiquinol oxidase subunit II, partial [Candidatus Omnitrophota bacterium]|nr:cytochrome D ubiquinol oxidase subunit II [Candidatus Omnitrophota bacterium]